MEVFGFCPVLWNLREWGCSSIKKLHVLIIYLLYHIYFFLRASVSYFDKIPNLIAGMLSRVVRNYHKLLSHVLRACESKRIWTPEVEDLRLLLWHSHYLAGLQAAHVDSRLGFLCADALVVGWECCHGTSSCVCLFSACYNGVIKGQSVFERTYLTPPPPPPSN